MFFFVRNKFPSRIVSVAYFRLFFSFTVECFFVCFLSIGAEEMPSGHDVARSIDRHNTKAVLFIGKLKEHLNKKKETRVNRQVLSEH